MVDEQHAQQVPGPGLDQGLLQAAELPPADAAGGEERERGARGRDSDQGDVADHPQRGEARRPAASALRTAQPGCPEPHGLRPGRPHAGVVIARDDPHRFGRSQPAQPVPDLAAFGGEPDLGQVSGHHDLVRGHLPQVREDRLQDLRSVLSLAPPLPGEVAERPLVQQVPDPGSGGGGEVEVREVGDAGCLGHGRPDVRGPLDFTLPGDR